MSGENQYLITADGMVYPLGALGVRLTGDSDVPVTYQTTQGYGQHGVTVQDWRLTRRTLSFAFEQYTRDRRMYAAARAAVIDALRPNRGPSFRRSIRRGRGTRFGRGGGI